MHVYIQAAGNVNEMLNVAHYVALVPFFTHYRTAFPPVSMKDI